jgi:hypothetical protein
MHSVVFSLAVRVFVSLLWHVQQFFCLKFEIPAEMPRRDVTLTDKTALLEQVKNQLPNISHCQLMEITGVPK